ncbi:MAG: helix-turn-helix domain-containing protein [Christensenellaceae bacterium]|nr:helix-turn-helix domain-containing protein [Christensenellaceae bacterium]
MATIPSRLREALSLRNMKQIELSEHTGINKGAISSYLSGKYEPKQHNISLMAKALDVSEGWLMGQDVPMQEASPSVDDELYGYLEELKNRSEMRMLFQLAKGATKSDVETAVKIIEALRMQGQG